MFPSVTAIETKQLAPTNTKGERIIATGGDAGRIIVNYNYALSGSANHAKAATMLRESLDWNQYGPMMGGFTKLGMAWVFISHSKAV